MTVKISSMLINNKECTILSAPYHPECSHMAKNIGGKWWAEKKLWYFDLRDNDRVATMAAKLWGSDGSDSSEKDVVTIRLSFPNGYGASKSGISIAGRSIAYAWGRDSGAKLGEGIIVIEGSAYSGGSVKNWTTSIRKGSVFEVRDLPRGALKILNELIEKDNESLKRIHEASIKYSHENPECACVKHSRIATCEQCNGTGIRQPSPMGSPDLNYEIV